MSHAKWKKTENPDTSWIGEKILAGEDKLMEQLAKARFDPPKETPPADTSPAPATDTPVDLAAERAAFADLLQFMADHPEDDCEVVALTAEEFSQETFTPADGPGDDANAADNQE